MNLSPGARQLVGSQFFGGISASTSGDNTVVTGVANHQIRVVRYSLMCAGAVVLTWKSSVAGAVSGPRSFAANGGKVEPYCPEGIIQTALGEDLVLNLSGNVSVGGDLTYMLI